MIRKSKTIRIISALIVLSVVFGNCVVLNISSSNDSSKETTQQTESLNTNNLHKTATGNYVTHTECDVTITDKETAQYFIDVCDGGKKPVSDFYTKLTIFNIDNEFMEFFNPIESIQEPIDIYLGVVEQKRIEAERLAALKKAEAERIAKEKAEAAKKAKEQAEKEALREAEKKENKRENAEKGPNKTDFSTDKYKKATLTAKLGGKKTTLPVKEMLLKIVSTEVNEGLAYEAIKAQVVASHTYILYYNSQGQTPSMGRGSTPKKGGKVERAVNEVLNEVMYYNGKPIFSPYCSSNSGRSESSEYAWSSALPYLKSVESKYDNLASGYKKTKTLSISDAKKRLENKFDIKLSSNPEEWFVFLDGNAGSTPGGYVYYMLVGGKRVRGTAVQSALGLRSSCFTIKTTSSNIKVTTYGHGHGVGLSQWGAHYYAKKAGWDYKQILTHYFTGVTIK